MTLVLWAEIGANERKQKEKMNLKNLIKTDGHERAVSPVIGVILMVAITVILAAVIGAFVIGIGEDQEVQPTASFNFDQGTLDIDNIESDEEVTSVTVRHSTGDTIASDELSISVNGDPAWIVDADEEELLEPFNDGDISSGNQDTIAAYGNDGGHEADIDGYNDPGFDIDGDEVSELEEGDTVQVVWTSETGDSSSTLGSSDVQ